MIEDFINEAVLEGLVDEGHDYLHEIIAIYGVTGWNGNFLQTKVEYRGVNGEYGILSFDSSPEDFFAAYGMGL